MPIKPITVPRLYQRIAEEIGQLIDAGMFAPGERLPAERALARSLKVSRSSLREALGTLEMQGRVVIRVGSGVYVSTAKPRVTARARTPAGLSPFDVLRARQLVEGEAAALAARHARPAQIEAMAVAFERLAEEMRADGLRAPSDRDFHLCIAAACGNSALEMLVERLWREESDPLSERIGELFVTGGRRRDNIAEHRAVLQAIQAHDAAGARRAMRRHLRNAERQRMMLLGENG